MRKVAADFFPDDDIPDYGIPDCVVPDYVAPITGYRMWALDALNHLRSLSADETWYPGKPITAICKDGARHVHHQPPHEMCTCGIYALKTREQLTQFTEVHRGFLSGEVYLWGKVVEHRYGWRAHFALPKDHQN